MPTTAPKHQPATPLPFSVRDGANISNFQKGKFFIVSGLGLDRLQIATMTRGPKVYADATYIAHAANAYPRLVEALREIRTTTLDRACVPIIDEVLRELGEAE